MKKLSYIVVTILFFVLMYNLNIKTQYVCDDFQYCFKYETEMPTESSTRVQTVGDIVESMKNHYFLWGGRIFAHGILQLLMIPNDIVFNICNTIMYVILVLIIYLHINPRIKKWNIFTYIMLYIALWFFSPQFGMSILWKSGALNYLWMTVFSLAYMLMFRMYNGTEDRKKSFIKNVVAVTLGIFLGMTNENVGGAVIIMMLCYVIYWKRNKYAIPVWSIISIIMCTIGTGMLVMAPGNFERNGSEMTVERFVDAVVYVLTCTCVNLLPILFIIICLLVVLSMADLKNIPQKIRNSEKTFVYLLSGISSVVVLVVSPVIALRSWMFFTCCMIILCGILFDKIVECFGVKNKKIYVLTSICSLLFIVSYSIAERDISITYKEVQRQVKEIENQKSKGQIDITVTGITPTNNKYNAFSGNLYLSEDREAWLNSWMATYYEVESIGIKAN